MKEIFRHHDITRVNYCRELLEAAGIPTMLRNEHLVHGVIEIPIPEFYPNLCVMKDADYERGWKILNEDAKASEKDPGPDLACPHCGEMNPGNFAACYSCEKPLLSPK